MAFEEHEYTDDFKAHIEICLNEILVDSGVSFLEVELTGRCGNRCEYCGVNAPDDTDIPINVLSEFIIKWNNEIRNREYTPVISLTGGDSMLYPHLKQLINLLKRINIEYMFKTNAHSINNKTINLPYKPSAVKMTIPDQSDNGRCKDTMSELINASGLLHNLDIDIIWQASVYNDNMDSLLNIISNINPKYPITLSIGRILPFKEKHKEKYSITPEKYHNFLNELLKIYSYIHKKGVTLRFRESLWIPTLAKAGLLPDSAKMRSYQSCDCFQPQLSIDRYGNVYPCGLIRKTKLGNIYDSPSYLLSQRSIEMNPKMFNCFSCRYFKICGGCIGASETVTEKKQNCDPHCKVKF